ncbi:DUF5050 domain-containing protein [Paenibacillus sp. 7124]|uniref:DUF5050 domain-containing protein n=1 Tax=Paenibacillus apii TaxID=1850370 RepID=A0A6M1PKJ2_9BACL|nr:DUF5050 domain-containing protein [Paenibacillus apii]NGM82825.1 DUF5050 domain-containing protein [Paenibacillus apii]NJJ39965.1 DUF5050 domain-containing protein [Paenibacillus apii]
MNGNLYNGGLVHRDGESLLVTDIKRYSGTYLIHNETSFDIFTDNLMWFMNGGESGILYSDQRRGNRLFRFAPAAREDELVLDKPCAQPILCGGLIYYMDERDGGLYCCAEDGRHDRRLTEEKVSGFLLLDDESVVCATAQGIKLAGAAGRRAETVSPAVAGRMVQAGNVLAFADRGRDLALTLLDLGSGETTAVDGIFAASINTDGRYLYCTNRRNGGSLYRVDPRTGTGIRMSGESADYLHVLDGDIYFSRGREWYRLPLAGGEAEKLPAPGGGGHAD